MKNWKILKLIDLDLDKFKINKADKNKDQKIIF